MINGLRVKQARELRKLTQISLAERIGVTQSTIAKIETSIRDWPSDLVEAISIQTGFPSQFFRRDIGPDFPLGSLLFRCRASLATNEKNSLRQLAQLTYEITQRMADKMKPLDLHFPSLNGESPREAARLTRSILGIAPDTPIPHLINKLERNGVFVFALPVQVEKFDAFSLWVDDGGRKPVIFLACDKPGDKMRFSCAHELGHLILHRTLTGKLVDVEQEANEFASEFLLPEEAMKQEIQSPVTVTSLAELKPKWGVSIQALIKRAYDLEILSERQYRYMFEQVSKMGWRKKEPGNLDIQPEKPRLFRKLAEILYGIPVNVEAISTTHSIPISLIESLLSVHASTIDLPKKQKNEDAPKLKEKPGNSHVTSKVLSWREVKRSAPSVN